LWGMFATLRRSSSASKTHRCTSRATSRRRREQARAYRLMDNRSHEDASWYRDLLAAELEEADLALSLTGFEESELAQLLTFEQFVRETDEDESPNLEVSRALRVGKSTGHVLALSWRGRGEGAEYFGSAGWRLQAALRRDWVSSRTCSSSGIRARRDLAPQLRL